MNSLKHEKTVKECFDIQVRGPQKREAQGICPVCPMVNLALGSELAQETGFMPNPSTIDHILTLYVLSKPGSFLKTIITTWRQQAVPPPQSSACATQRFFLCCCMEPSLSLSREYLLPAWRIRQHGSHINALYPL